jgi:EmrB/QacA subfamily drug resistance transporter
MTSAAAAVPATPTDDRLPPALVKLALAIMLGAVMVGLDATMVNVALNTLAHDFHTSFATIQWVSTGYLLALAMVIPATGWAIERFGAKPMWLLSISLFTAGSMLCGLSWSAGSMIGFRVLQGMGGGMIVPLMQTILAQAAGPKRMGRVMGVIGIPAMLGPVLGPMLGGLIVSDASWRLIFYINLPICVIALLATSRVTMPDTKRANGSPLDVLGLGLLSPALAAIVYGLSQAGTHGSFANGHAYVPVAAGAVLLLGFIAYALRTRTEPIIDLRLFRARSFTGSSAVIFLFSMAMLGSALLLPLYYQQVRGEDALHAGLLLAPQGLGMGVALILSGRLTERIGARPIIVTGLVLTAASMLAYTRIGAHTSLAFISAVLVVSGFGLGAALVPAMTSAYDGLTKDAVARATSSLRIFQQLGGSFGIAILVVVLQNQLSATTRRTGLAGAYAHTFWWAVAITLLALLPALLLPGRTAPRQARAATR